MAINRNKILKNAQHFMAKGQIKKAIKEFYKVVEDDPKDVRTLLKLGDLYSRENMHNEAIETYKQVANHYTADGFFLKAIAVYKQILKLTPEGKGEVVLKLADLFHQLGLISDAIANYNLVAEEYEAKGLKKESLELYKKIAGLNPDDIGGKLKLADMYFQEGYGPQALAELKSLTSSLKEKNLDNELIRVMEKMFSFDSNNMGILKDLAEVYLRNDEAKQALLKLEVAYKTNPEDLQIVRLLGDTFMQLGEKEKAKAVFEKLSQGFKTRGMELEALEISKKIADAGIDSGSATHELAAGQGEPFATAIEPLNLEKMYSGETSVVSRYSKLFTEAEVYWKYGLKQKAIRQLESILAEDAGNELAHFRLKKIFTEEKEYTKAASHLVALSALMEKRGEAVQALACLKEARNLDSENQEIVSRIGQLSGNAGESGSIEKMNSEISEMDSSLLDLDGSFGDERELSETSQTNLEIPAKLSAESLLDENDIADLNFGEDDQLVITGIEFKNSAEPEPVQMIVQDPVPPIEDDRTQKQEIADRDESKTVIIPEVAIQPGPLEAVALSDIRLEIPESSAPLAISDAPLIDASPKNEMEMDISDVDLVNIDIDSEIESEVSFDFGGSPASPASENVPVSLPNFEIDLELVSIPSVPNLKTETAIETLVDAKPAAFTADDFSIDIEDFSVSSKGVLEPPSLPSLETLTRLT